MRITVLVILLLTSVAAQNSKLSVSEQRSCGANAQLLYRPVVRKMWSQDEGEHPFAIANGFIRIAVHPAWSPDYFIDIRLNPHDPATIVTYSLPKGTKSVTLFLENALKENPCADVATLAAALPVKKHTLSANQPMKDLIAQFFAIQFAPRPISDIVRLDATEYEVEFIGNDTILFDSNDDQTPMVKWVQSLASAIPDLSR